MRRPSVFACAAAVTAVAATTTYETGSATTVTTVTSSASSTSSTSTTSTSTPTDLYHLQTRVKSGQDDKDDFDGLFLYSYHTGAGLSDAMLSANASHAVSTYFVGSNTSTATASAGAGAARAENADFFDVRFELGTTSIPRSLQPVLGVNTYAAWQPVRINIGTDPSTNTSAFFLGSNSSLQWTNAVSQPSVNSFGGWLACKWWHADIDDSTTAGTQLFFRVSGFGQVETDGCADVDLVVVDM